MSHESGAKQAANALAKPPGAAKQAAKQAQARRAASLAATQVKVRVRLGLGLGLAPVHLVSHAAHDISPLHLPYNLPKSPVHLVSHAAHVRGQPEREG